MKFIGGNRENNWNIQVNFMDRFKYYMNLTNVYLIKLYTKETE